MNKREIHLADVAVGLRELEILQSFLKQNGLPWEDIQPEGNRFFLYYNGGTLVGSGGLEFHGNYCLLRSVAVASEFRGKDCGKEIVKDLIERVDPGTVWSISLLTETAQLFFDSLGFEMKSRDNAPKEIRSSSEFSSVCPVSAVYMEKILRTPS